MSVVGRLRERARAHRDATALVEGRQTWSYAELFDRVDRLAAGLHALGLRPGDSVLAWLSNVHEAIETELAVLDSGLVWITLAARLSVVEVGGVLASCEPSLIVTGPDGLASLGAWLVGALGPESAARAPAPGAGQRGPAWARDVRILVTGELVEPAAAELRAPGVEVLGYEALLRAHAPRRVEGVVDGEQVARLRYTSGTTGGAKAAVLPHRVYEACLDNLLRELTPLGATQCALHAAPLTHGSGGLVHPVLWAGGCNVLLDHFEVGTVLELIERHRVTAMFTVPTILQRLVASEQIESRDLSSLRAVIYGGAPIAEGALRAAVATLGPVLLHTYGMTEAPWPITTLRPEEHRLDNPRLRSIGKVTSICELRAVDAAGEVVAPGQVGELQVRGGNVMHGYYRDEAATRAVLVDGWLASGDLGTVDEAGYWYIVDRKKDVIISGGFNVYAAEVEAALCELAGVREAAVVGLPDPEWGEEVCAVLVLEPEARLGRAEVEGFCRTRLAGYKRPRTLEFVAELPRTATGKAAKALVREQLAARRAGAR